MAFRRRIVPETFATGDNLDSDLCGIGFLLSDAKPNYQANIEDTLMAGALDAWVHKRSRTLPLLTDWLSIHFRRVNTDRLLHLVGSCVHEAVRIYFVATAQRFASDPRSSVRKLRAVYHGPRRNITALLNGKLDSANDGTDLLIRRNGEDDRFVGTCLRVPGRYIRQRPRDVLDPAELAGHHAAYRRRIMLGSTYRADMWAAFDVLEMPSTSQVARFSYGTFEMARQVVADSRLLATV